MMRLAAPPVVVVPEEYRQVRYGEMHRDIAGELGGGTRVIAVGTEGLVQACGVDARGLADHPGDPDAPLYVVWTSVRPAASARASCTRTTPGWPACTATWSGSVRRGTTRCSSSRRSRTTSASTPCTWSPPTAIRSVLLESWSPEAASSLISHARPTFSSVTPTFLFDLLGSEATACADLSSLRMTNCSGAPVPPALIELAGDVLPHCRILSAYGASEEGRHRLGRARRPGGGLAEILGRPRETSRFASWTTTEPARRTVKRASCGCARRRRWRGYLQQEHLTQAAFPEDGWRATGDRGRLHRDGASRSWAARRTR